MAKKKEPKELTVAGALIGIAAVVPGVSSGTMALITGAYDTIIEVCEQLLETVQKKNWGKAIFPWKALTKLAVGGIIGVGLAAILISTLLTNMPHLLAALFTGMIITSSYMLLRNETQFYAKEFYAGTILALVIALLPQIHLFNNGITVFLLGMLAGAASILPGLSGSAIILIFGFYPLFATSLVQPVSQIGFLFPLVLGGIVGFALSVHVIRAVLKKIHTRATSFFVGMALGGIALLAPTMLVTTGIELFGVIIAFFAGAASGFAIAKN